jgi:uncharacterized membrane protein
MGNVPFRSDVKQDMAAWKAALPTPLAPADAIEVPFANTALSGPVAYLPQAVGVGIGTRLGMPALSLLYAGRLATLLICAMLTALAVRRLPVRPWTCVLLSLLPMTLFVRSSVSSDAPTLALALLAVAVCCQLAARAPASLGPADAVPLYAIAALLALGKPPYAAVTMMALALPSRLFRSARARLVTLGILVALVAVLQLVWMLAMRGRTEVWAPGSDPAAQIAFIAGHPLTTAGVLLRDLAIEMPALLHQMIGVLGWLDAPVATAVVVFLALAIVLVALGEAPLQSAGLRWMAAALGAGGIIVMQALNYVYWTPPGALHVDGLQGRHLTPFVPLLLLALPVPLAIARPLRRVRSHLVVAFVVVAVAATVATVMRRYYL